MPRPVRKQELGIELKEHCKSNGISVTCDVLDVAKYIITKCTIEDRPVNHDTLQILLFILQKEALDCVGSPIHNGVFVALQDGPWVLEIHDHYVAMGYIRRFFPDPTSVVQGKKFIDHIIMEALQMKTLSFRHASTKVGGAWHTTWTKHRGEEKEIPIYLIKSKG